jgi:propanol-preferring alcohol dehydrogenase
MDDYGLGLLRNHGKCVVFSFRNEGFHVSADALVSGDISVVGA